MSENPQLSQSAVQASREIRAVVGRLKRRLRRVAEDEDVTFSQATVLARLADKEGVTTSALAEEEGVRHQSMAATVAALESLGLITRRPDPGDGRRLLIGLTPAGRRRVEEGRQARREWLAGRLQEMCTEEERMTVIAAMAVLERIVHD